jgi:chemotaxis signal transduction protein
MSEPQPKTMPQLDARLQARKRFFAQPIPPGYSAEWAEILAQPLPEESELKDSMLEFRIADLPLAISSRLVKAVTAPLAVCPVPHRDNTAFLGLVAFAGDIIPCVSLARILGAADAITAAESRTIILEERPGERWAFRVDAVLGVSTGTVHDRKQHTGQLSQLSSDWTDLLFEDERKQLIDILRPETLFQRLQRATA